MKTAPIIWPGGEHEFALRIGELRALQQSCDAGPEEVLMRLRAGTWRVNDVIEPIRLGLIGSGAVDSREAGPMVMRVLDQTPILGLKLTALEILFRALAAPEGEDLGEGEGVETPAPENGGSASSTATAQ